MGMQMSFYRDSKLLSFQRASTPEDNKVCRKYNYHFSGAFTERVPPPLKSHSDLSNFQRGASNTDASRATHIWLNNFLDCMGTPTPDENNLAYLS